MTSVERQLRAECKKLLEDSEVDVILGYRRGTLPLRTAPMFVRDVDDVDQLIWDVTCENSLSVYVPRLKGQRIGIVAKGCDGRWLAEQISENQVSRDNVKVIAVPCHGVVSRRKLLESVDHKPIMSGHVQGEHIAVAGAAWEQTIPVADVLESACQSCVYKGAPFADIDLGRADNAGRDSFADVSLFADLSMDERWQAFAAEVDKCVRCYACRQACPGCFCKVCFVERSRPAIIGVTDDKSDVMMFHLIRALHLAGRCVDCGACEKACPMGVNLRLLNRKLQHDARELFGYVAGLDLDEKPMIASYRPDDPEDFIM